MELGRRRFLFFFCVFYFYFVGKEIPRDQVVPTVRVVEALMIFRPGEKGGKKKEREGNDAAVAATTNERRPRPDIADPARYGSDPSRDLSLLSLSLSSFVSWRKDDEEEEEERRSRGTWPSMSVSVSFSKDMMMARSG